MSVGSLDVLYLPFFVRDYCLCTDSVRHKSAVHIVRMFAMLLCSTVFHVNCGMQGCSRCLSSSNLKFICSDFHYVCVNRKKKIDDTCRTVAILLHPSAQKIYLNTSCTLLEVIFHDLKVS
jgi:hypothetical protein